MKISWVVVLLGLSPLARSASSQGAAEAPRVASRAGTIAGSDEDGVDISRTVDLVVTGKGQVVAVQMIDGALRVYTERDGFVKQLGRVGDGPGEFRRPISAGM